MVATIAIRVRPAYGAFMVPAKVGDKNRVYLPSEVVKALKVKRREYVLFRIIEGKVTLEKLK